MKWHVKEIAKLTNISVQTLHYYDRINLLNPSVRMSNGYRLYSEKDLIKLQQIIALKFFGFSLVQIKNLLTNDIEVLKQLELQAKLLKQKADDLLAANKTLKNVISEVKADKSFNLEIIVNLIKVYNMIQEKNWITEVLSPTEIEQYKDFAINLSKLHLDRKKKFEEDWMLLTKEIKRNLNASPVSTIGLEISKKCLDLLNSVFGKEHANLRTRIFEQGFGEGIGLTENHLTTDIVSWLDRAMDNYVRTKAYDILAQVGKISSSEVLKLWDSFLDEIYGYDVVSREAILNAALKDENISQDAKKWLLANSGR